MLNLAHDDYLDNFDASVTTREGKVVLSVADESQSIVLQLIARQRAELGERIDPGRIQRRTRTRLRYGWVPDQ